VSYQASLHHSVTININYISVLFDKGITLVRNETTGIIKI
jgi:hypothetical protein